MNIGDEKYYVRGGVVRKVKIVENSRKGYFIIEFIKSTEWDDYEHIGHHVMVEECLLSSTQSGAFKARKEFLDTESMRSGV